MKPACNCLAHAKNRGLTKLIFRAEINFEFEGKLIFDIVIMLAWSDKFVTGHPLIDHQHRMLVSFINRLERLSFTTEFSTRETVLVRDFINFVETYLATHFRDEEKCMQRLKCPAHLENQKAHADFADFFGQFKSRFVAEGYRPELVKELFNFCVFWIQRHILRIDIQLRSCHEESAMPGDMT